MADTYYYVDPYALTSTSPVFLENDGGYDWIILTGAPYIVGGPNDFAVWIALGQGGSDIAFVNFTNFSLNPVPPTVTQWIYGIVENAIGGQGSDQINGSRWDNYIQGDALDVAGATDALYGEGGQDTLVGAGGSDYLSGGDGNDLLFGDSDPFSQDLGNYIIGNDTIFGGAGNDRIYGGSGTNYMNGDSGFDTVDYSGFFDDFGNFSYRLVAYNESYTAIVYAKDLSTGVETIVAQDTIYGFEAIIGTNGADRIEARYTTLSGDATLSGVPPGDVLYGGGGKDILYGGTGADTIYGGDDDDYIWDFDNTLPSGAGNDMLYGGNGNDYYTVSSDRTRVIETATGGYDYVMARINYTLPTNVEHLYLSNNYTALNGTGNALDNQIEGNLAANDLNGLSGNDYLFGMDGNDTLRGGVGNDFLYGGLNDDMLLGANQSDKLFGDAGNDSLYGGTENDSLYGGGNDDFLQGGAGRDLMMGGRGADVFFFAAASDSTVGRLHDVISDFTSGQDHIDLHRIVKLQTYIADDKFNHTGAPEVRYDPLTGMITGDTNGDGKGDYQIFIGVGTILISTDLIL